MKLKLYQHQIMTNKIHREKTILNNTHEDYIFIVENDDKHKYYIETRYNRDDKVSYIQLSIEDGYSNDIKIYERKWTINHYSQIYKNVYQDKKIEELENLFESFQRRNKINRLLSDSQLKK